MKVDRPILFFDGLCHLCNTSVDIVMKYKKQGSSFFVASLQGETSKTLIPLHYIQELSSLIFYDAHGHILTKSRAIIALSSYLQFPFNFLGKLLKIFPEKLLDTVYDGIAKKRYRWWGKRAQCRLPTEKERSVFLP